MACCVLCPSPTPRHALPRSQKKMYQKDAGLKEGGAVISPHVYAPAPLTMITRIEKRRYESGTLGKIAQRMPSIP
jgi:hypothetical protein